MRWQECSHVPLEGCKGTWCGIGKRQSNSQQGEGKRERCAEGIGYDRWRWNLDMVMAFTEKLRDMLGSERISMIFPTFGFDRPYLWLYSRL